MEWQRLLRPCGWADYGIPIPKREAAKFSSRSDETAISLPWRDSQHHNEWRTECDFVGFDEHQSGGTIRIQRPHPATALQLEPGTRWARSFRKRQQVRDSDDHQRESVRGHAKWSRSFRVAVGQDGERWRRTGKKINRASWRSEE